MMLLFESGRDTARKSRGQPKPALVSARSREVGVAIQMLLTEAEQVSGDACAPPRLKHMAWVRSLRPERTASR